jgi:hypothetical protein
MNELEIGPVLNDCSVLGKQVIQSVRAIEKAKHLRYADQSGWKAAVFEVLGAI